MRQIQFLPLGTFWNFASQPNTFRLRLAGSKDVEPVVLRGRQMLVRDSVVGGCLSEGALVTSQCSD